MKRVLIVDDDTNFRRSLAIGLEAMGYEVVEARSGMEALEMLQSGDGPGTSIERAVVDARMPGLDGFWLTDQLALMYPELKVVILSAHAYPNEHERYTLLTKPVRLPNLASLLETT